MNNIRHACTSDPGRSHLVNEDRWFADPFHGFYFVCDGMANAIAPQVVIDMLPPLLEEWLAGHDRLDEPQLAGELQWLLGRVNKMVCLKVSEQGLPGLGTTLVLAAVKQNQALIAHVGDSRAYLYRDAELKRLTEDHAVQSTWLDRKATTEAEAERPRVNLGPTRFLGQSKPPEAEIQLLTLQASDRLLLCSDGLTEMLSDKDMLILIDPLDSPKEICNKLVDAANKAGGYDNITALVVAVE